MNAMNLFNPNNTRVPMVAVAVGLTSEAIQPKR